MFEIKKNEKNKSAVILNPERSEWVSRSHVTGVESVVNDGAKTQCYSAKRDLYGHSLRSTLKMTALAFLLSLNISESRAAWSDNCPSGTTAGTTCKTCGDNCAYTENSEHVVTIYGSGEIDYTFKTVNGKYGYYDANNNPNPFYKNESITGVQFAKGSNFTTIGKSAFNGASSLTSITIPEGVTSIGNHAFEGARSLTSITIPNSVTSIGYSAFYGAGSLTSVNFGENSQLTSIGEFAFSDAYSLTSITIPEGVTSIERRAFEGASGLTSITIPEGVTSIGGSAFTGASGLTSITLPDSLTSIGWFAFAGASSLTSITIPEGVTSIGDHAFAGASGLTSITLPGSLTSVDSDLFYGADNLTEINCAGTESECAALRTLLDTKGYLPDGRTFKRVEPVTKCSSYTSSGCDACYAGYALGDDSCHECGAGKNCHWDEDVGVVFDGCKDKYLRKENECVASSQGCGANFRLNDGECDRLRYTPAEAAEVLTNDNNNSVTITFKI